MLPSSVRLEPSKPDLRALETKLVRKCVHVEQAASFRYMHPSVEFVASPLQEVLLLHEVETLIKFVPPEACGAVLDVIMPKVRDLFTI